MSDSKAKKYHGSLNRTFITMSLILVVLIAAVITVFVMHKPSDVAATIELNNEKAYVYNSEVDDLYQSFQEQNITISREQIASQLANLELLMLQAKQKGISADPAYIENLTNQEIEQFKEQVGEDVLLSELEKQGKTLDQFAESIKKTIERDLVIRALFAADLFADVQVSDAQVQEYYTNNPDQFYVPESVSVKHILICSAESAGCESTRTKADALVLANQISAEATPVNFAQYAVEYSDDSASGAVGGDIGTIYPGQTVEPFETAAFSLDVGTVSDPVETAYGYHIILVSSKAAAQMLAFDLVKDQIEQQLIANTATERQEGYLKGLLSQAKITYN